MASFDSPTNIEKNLDDLDKIIEDLRDSVVYNEDDVTTYMNELHSALSEHNLYAVDQVRSPLENLKHLRFLDNSSELNSSAELIFKDLARKVRGLFSEKEFAEFSRPNEKLFFMAQTLSMILMNLDIKFNEIQIVDFLRNEHHLNLIPRYRASQKNDFDKSNIYLSSFQIGDILTNSDNSAMQISCYLLGVQTIYMYLEQYMPWVIRPSYISIVDEDDYDEEDKGFDNLLATYGIVVQKTHEYFMDKFFLQLAVNLRSNPDQVDFVVLHSPNLEKKLSHIIGKYYPLGFMHY